MTIVYFVRHAQSDHQNHDEMTRCLSPRGLRDRELVTRFLTDKGVDMAFSSPYKRAVDTIADFTEKYGLTINMVDDFREWQRISYPNESFDELCRRQWSDLDYRNPDSESLRDVQRRNISALENILETCDGKNVIIGTHGMALSTVINYYDPNFGYAEFSRLLPLMPLVVKMTFEGKLCRGLEQIEIV